MLEQYITQTAKKTITATDIRRIEMPVPLMGVQQKYEEAFFKIQATKKKMRASLDEMDNHFKALTQRYFG